MAVAVDYRRGNLQSLLSDGSLERELKHASRFAGRRPGWHLEKGLLKRAQLAGFSGLVKDFGHLQSKDFEEQLDKGENLMVETAHFKGNKRRLVEASLRVRNACKFPSHKFEPTTLEFAAENQINRTSSAGFPFFRRKGLVMDKLIAQAKVAISDPFSGMWFWPCVRGFRIQIRETLGNLYRKVRLMYPYPGFIILIEDTFIIPFVAHFIATPTFYIIGLNGEQIGKRLKSALGKTNKICSLDISAYDQSLVNEAIIMAFWIIRSQLRLTKEQSICFDNMVKYFCTSIMVSKAKKGKTFKAFIRHHGVPSGSGFTNMIDTLAHAIVFEYLEPGILKNESTLICGDDNIFDSKNVNVEKLFKGYKESFNLTVDKSKTDFYTSPLKVKFLGFIYNNYERFISYKLALNQALWHTDFLVDLDPYEREVARSASVFLNGKNGKLLFSKLFPDVMYVLERGGDVRFRYLVGYSPPTSIVSPVVSGRIPTITQSLREQLETGYLTR